MSISHLASLAVLAVAFSGQTDTPKYAAGQIWEYRTRSQDSGSLLKIEQVGDLDGSKVYHVSIVGVKFAAPGAAGILPHIPVSEKTLNDSVIRLSSTKEDFPTTALQEGIFEWRRANGGVFTIPVSQIIDIIDDQIGRAQQATGAQPTSS